ncbi:Atu4866 domain-containing protein [Streptomyces sp. NPDC056835]|uniref:Atu4866 domain-containing protein n=1 Tax=Streptomyces sp. NPDC056835 TaxID=3345956 RepID=UPI0036AFB8DA
MGRSRTARTAYVPHRSTEGTRHSRWRVRGNRRSACTSSCTITGNHIDYVDDTGFVDARRFARQLKLIPRTSSRVIAHIRSSSGNRQLIRGSPLDNTARVGRT